MKNPYSPAVGAAGLADWLKQDNPRHSLVVGATCGCDLSRLAEDVCDYLNRPGRRPGGFFRAFDPQEIRRLAGDPHSRNPVLAAAERRGVVANSRCDLENMVRGVAAAGGAVLAGQCALDATEDLDNVFRVSLSRCDLCRPRALLDLDPDGFSHEGLAAIIGKRFVRWCEEQVAPRHPRTAAASLETVFA